jgi:hypothetical protein
MTDFALLLNNVQCDSTVTRMPAKPSNSKSFAGTRHHRR